MLIGVSIIPSISGIVEKINNSNILDFDEFEESFQKKRMENYLMLDRNDVQKLFASDGTTDDLFGCSVSIDGDYALIGVEEDDDNGDYSGSAYIFKRDGAVWTEQSKLLPSDGDERECFGCSVSIDGDFAIIGACHDDDFGYSSGSAYVFKRDGAVWTEQSKLLPSDGTNNHTFGCSVSIDGDYAIIGALGDKYNGEYSGSAYIFKCDGAVWTEQSKLLPSDGGEFQAFGNKVSIGGDYAIISAPGDNDNGYVSGSAYIFKRDGAVWTEQTKLIASDGEQYEYFGRSISINGQYALIGAWGDDDNGCRSGSAYIFKHDGNIWTQQAKLLPSDGVTCDYFGFSVSMDGDYAIIGAYGDESVSVYKRNGLTWSKHVKLVAPDGVEEDGFGWSVSMDGDYAIIGALASYGNEPRSGSAYVFKNFSVFQSPNVPLINGPTDGKVGIEYTFNISTIDPDNDDVYYFIDWGKHTYSGWLGPFESGKEVSANHTWLKQGTFKIRIRAKNTMGAVSDWAEYNVTITKKSRAINTPFLSWLQNYFNLFPILKLLLQRFGLQ